MNHRIMYFLSVILSFHTSYTHDFNDTYNETTSYVFDPEDVYSSEGQQPLLRQLQVLATVGVSDVKDLKEASAETGSYLAQGPIKLIETGDLKKFNEKFNRNFVNLPTRDGWTQLTKAIDVENLECIIFLLDKGAATNIPGPNGLPLTAAVASGNYEITELLLKSGATVNAPDGILSGGPALSGTVDFEMIRLLVKYGADTNKENSLNRTPLIIAAEHGATEACQLLIDFNANVNHEDSDGFTALHMATLGNHLETVEILLSAHANVNKGPGGHTPLMFAVKIGSVDMVRVLLKAGSPVDAKTTTGATALIAAVEASTIAYRENLAQLISVTLQNLMPDIVAKMEAEAHQASQNDNLEKQELESLAWQTVDEVYVQAVSEKEYPEIVRLLLEYNADITAINNDGLTVFDFEMNDEVRDILASRGAKSSN